MSQVKPNTKAQRDFDAKYITAGEIVRELNTTRTALLGARNRGMLPDAIVVTQHGAKVFIWERDKLKPHLAAWKRALQSRRGELTKT